MNQQSTSGDHARAPGWRPPRRLRRATTAHRSASAERPAPACPPPAGREVFERVASFTVGAEQELVLVDPVTLLPVSSAGAGLDLASGSGSGSGSGRIVPELRSCQVEVVTPVCATAAQAVRELEVLLVVLRLELAGRADGIGAGTHPFARDVGPISPLPRHRQLALEYPWAAPRVLTCGLHVHVALGGADRALAVFNALRSYLPELGALGANSPFYRGRDSRLASVRHCLLRHWPRTGTPPVFPTWAAYDDFVTWGRRAGACEDDASHWWDLRLSPRYGTIEVRIADTPLRTADAEAVIALTQSLVAHLAARYDRGERLSLHPSERIAEGVWLSARDGILGSSIDLDTGDRMPMAERLRRLAHELLPDAAELGCADELLGVERLLRDPAPSRQRRIASRRGMSGLVAWLAQGAGDEEPGYERSNGRSPAGV